MVSSSEIASRWSSSGLADLLTFISSGAEESDSPLTVNHPFLVVGVVNLSLCQSLCLSYVTVTLV